MLVYHVWIEIGRLLSNCCKNKENVISSGAILMERLSTISNSVLLWYVHYMYGRLTAVWTTCEYFVVHMRSKQSFVKQSLVIKYHRRHPTKSLFTIKNKAIPASAWGAGVIASARAAAPAIRPISAKRRGPSSCEENTKVKFVAPI